ncbi:MAG: Gfo/Idh/MocA family oxidoreductase [Gemmataceae bacterium]
MLSRRTFVQAATTLPMLPVALQAQRSPLEQVRLGFIGLGGQGTSNLRVLMKHAVALCDVDSERLGKARDAVLNSAKNRKVESYSDYRKMLESKELDAVVISTPDHWHALPTIDACNAGKHVYCEKPLTLTVAEGRAMVKAARANKAIVQCGSQQRSNDTFRFACELVRNGLIGKVHTVKVGIPGVNFKGPPVPDSDPPAVLDYEFWLGPAPKRPYNLKRVHYNFRFFWDYSGGQLTNWGAHHLDIAQWGLGMDDTGPIAIEGTASYHPQKWYEVPQSCTVQYTYANGVKMTLTMGGRTGTEFIGEKGSIFVTRGKIETTPKELAKHTFDDKATRLYESNSHHANWLQCIKSGKLPICDVEIGHRSATVCHLGNIALRTGKKLKWDPVKETLDDPQAAKMLSYEYRKPWKLPS